MADSPPADHANRQLAAPLHGARARRLTARIVAAIALGPGLVIVAQSPAASASPASRWGYAWANQPTSSHYTPNLEFQRQSNGRHVTVNRNGTGNYTVTFPGLAGANGGNVEVSAQQTDGWCQVASWSSSTDAGANVLCFHPGGAPLDSQFDILFTVGAGTPSYAYAWDDRSSSNGATESHYSFDGKGGTITTRHVDTGHYELTVPHLAEGNGTVKVTAYGTVPALCSVISWTGGFIDVACNNPSGAPMDSDFDVAFASGAVSMLGVTGHKSGYAFDYEPSSSGNLAGPYQFDSSGGAVHVAHRGTGLYLVTFPHLGRTNGDVEVTSYTSTPAHCAADGTNTSTTTADVYLICSDAPGHLTDTNFIVQYFV